MLFYTCHRRVRRLFSNDYADETASGKNSSPRDLGINAGVHVACQIAVPRAFTNVFSRKEKKGSMTFDVGQGNEYFFKVQSTVDICRK